MTDFVKDFTDGVFHLDCVNVVLTCSDQAFGEISGAGFVDLTDDGTIEFRVILEPNVNQTHHRLSSIFGSEDDSEAEFSFRAVDENDRIWTANKIRVKNQNFGTGTRWVFSGILDELHTEDHHINREQVGLVAIVPYLFPYPTNTTTKYEKQVGSRPSSGWQLDVAEFETSEYSFLMFSEADAVSIHVTSKVDSRTTHLHSRILESLVFMTGRELEFSSVTILEKDANYFTLYSTNRNVQVRNVFPPVYYKSMTAADDAINLFVKYFEYISKYTLPLRHPLSRRIYGLVRMSDSYISQHQLEACVVAESLIDDCPGIEQTASGEEMDGYVKLMDFIDKELTGLFKQRSQGVAKRLNYRSTASRLKDFARLHLLDPKLIKSWEDLRNKRAHGVFEDDEQVEPIKIEESQQENILIEYRRLRDVLFLVHTMVAEIIGYNGLITDNKDGFVHWPINSLLKYSLGSDSGISYLKW